MANQAIAQGMTTSTRRGKYCRPYTPEEAKARFRVAASRLGIGCAIQRAPWTSVGLALGTGLVLGCSQPLRQGLVKLGTLAFKSMSAVASHLRPSPLAGPDVRVDCR